MIGGLYVIENTLNGNWYVGTTVDFDRRFSVHRRLLRTGRHHSPHLQYAWNKYGEAAFRFMRLTMIEDKAEMVRVEQNFLDTLNPPYNISPTAASSAGVKRSEATRERLRTAMRDPKRLEHIRTLGCRPKSEEHRKRIAESHYGKKASEETRRKLREAWVRRRQNVESEGV